MTLPEQRKLDRFPLTRQPEGKVFLRTENTRHQITEIRDISRYGISFYLDHSMEVSAKVSVEYSDSKVNLEVYGRVAWCAERPRDNTDTSTDARTKPEYVLGIELMSPMVLLTMFQK